LTQPTNHDGGKRPRRLLLPLGALALLAVAALCGTGVAWVLRPPDVSEDKPTGPLAPYFHGWERPDLVLVVSAEEHGYLLPCGCSDPQKGGLERRYNLIQMLKGRGWPVLAVDLGNVPQTEAPAAPVALPNVEGLIKYQYAMRAKKLMGYAAVGIGDHEAAMPLSAALDSLLSLSEPTPPVVTADLMDRDDKFPGETKAWQKAEPVKGADVTVGVTAVIGPSVYDKIRKRDPRARFADTEPALKAVVKEMAAAKIDLPVLLYMGSISEGRDGSPPEAVACAKAFPQFPLIVGLDDSDLARAKPLRVADEKSGAEAMLISLGHKGKAVGVVGVFRTGKPARPVELRYQMVEMTEDFKTPAAQRAGHPVLALLEKFTKELKDDKYLAKVPQVNLPNQVGRDPMPKYVGTDRCGDCHKAAYAVWKDTPHHKAYQTLADAKWPSNRQYDPECVVCHTVGFGYKGGYRTEQDTPKLLNVGCESCHGPGSLHANNPGSAKLRAEMNPWKTPANENAEDKARRLRRIDDMCQKCHDPENDVHWNEGTGTETGFERHWPKIAHPTPPDEKIDATEP
jgi:hypothetical protein